MVIPILDQLNGVDNRNLDSNEEERIKMNKVFSYILYSWVVFQFLFLAWAFYVIPQFAHFGYTLGFVLGVGLVMGSIGITIAHELGHKKSKIEQTMSKILLMMVCYMHFFIEHNKGHHVAVGTPDDPATATKGETFYHFWYKSVFHGYIHAWKIENERLRRAGSSVLSWRNQMIQFTILPWIYCFSMMGLMFLIIGTWNWMYIGFFLAQSFVAFTLLETVNYVEHYGLSRKELDNGRFEPVKEYHSWNSSHVISNYFLFQLQLHTDHHMYAIKKYQTLQHVEDAPQLPAGYPTMILAALVPPIWYRVVHPILDKVDMKA